MKIVPMSRNDQNRVWAEISAADLLFLVEERPSRVIEAYREAVPKNGFFAWNAARGQLELFTKLGFKDELASKVISTIDRLVVRPEVDDIGDLQVVIFVGHRVDEAGRPVLRFPRDREPQARNLIREALSKAKTGWKRIEVLASAAPGSDILCHEELSEALDENVVPNAGFLAASEDPNRIRRDGSRCAAVAISNLGLRVVRGVYKVSPTAHQQLI